MAALPSAICVPIPVGNATERTSSSPPRASDRSPPRVRAPSSRAGGGSAAPLLLAPGSAAPPPSELAVLSGAVTVVAADHVTPVAPVVVVIDPAGPRQPTAAFAAAPSGIPLYHPIILSYLFHFFFFFSHSCLPLSLCVAAAAIQGAAANASAAGGAPRLPNTTRSDGTSVASTSYSVPSGVVSHSYTVAFFLSILMWLRRRSAASLSACVGRGLCGPNCTQSCCSMHAYSGSCIHNSSPFHYEELQLLNSAL